MPPGGSVGWAPDCHAGGREFNSGRTNTQGLEITEEKIVFVIKSANGKTL